MLSQPQGRRPGVKLILPGAGWLSLWLLFFGGCHKSLEAHLGPHSFTWMYLVHIWLSAHLPQLEANDLNCLLGQEMLGVGV